MLIGPVTHNFEEGAWSVSTPCNSHGGGGVTQTDTNINATDLADSKSLGRLEGRVLMNGGPLNPGTGEQALNGSPAAAHTVTIVSERTAVKYMVMSDAAGHFSVNLPSGTYLLDCASEPRVEVEPGAVASQDCAIPVP